MPASTDLYFPPQIASMRSSICRTPSYAFLSASGVTLLAIPRGTSPDIKFVDDALRELLAS